MTERLLIKENFRFKIGKRIIKARICCSDNDFIITYNGRRFNKLSKAEASDNTIKFLKDNKINENNLTAVDVINSMLDTIK